MGREKMFVGRCGERLALEFLKRKGYKVIEMNFRTYFGEIDAVAKKDGFIIFVEIKTRLTSSLGPPYLSITKAKERHIIKNALAYLKIKHLLGADWRIDVVSVKLNYDHELENIELFENAVNEY